jgi:signal transduction histidine kinase
MKCLHDLSRSVDGTAMTPETTGLRTAHAPWLLASITTAVLVCIASVGYANTGRTTGPFVVAGTVLVTASFVAAGMIAWVRRPENRTGPLMVLTGGSLALSLVSGPPAPLLSPVGLAAGTVSGVLLVYVILGFPQGRLRSTSDRWFVAIAATLLAGTNAARLAAFDPSADGLGFLNPYRVITDPDLAALTVAIERAATVGIMIGFLVILVFRWAGASRPARRVLGPVLAPAALLALAVLASVAADAGVLGADLQGVLFTTQILARATIPIGFLVGLLRTRMARAAVADLVIELGATPTPTRLRDALVHALGDQELSMAYWAPSSGRYVDVAGNPVVMPRATDGRAVTLLERDGTPLAAIVHDPALLEDPGLVSSVATAVRLTVVNERLEAQVGEQLEEVRASRARIVAAGDAERKRVERDLHDGAQQRLVALTLALRLAKRRFGPALDPDLVIALDDASDEAKAALTELRDLARGIHPQILTEAGLAAALQSLADRSTLQVTIESGATSRFSSAVESTAYFVVSEALANVAKYAGRDAASVRTSWGADVLTLEISDAGVGGADPARGSGLRGLTDRLAAVDGTLEVVSPRGGGTRLLARIPTLPGSRTA